MIYVRKKVILIMAIFLIQFLIVSCIQKPESNELEIEIDEAYYENKAVVIGTVADVFKEIGRAHV